MDSLQPEDNKIHTNRIYRLDYDSTQVQQMEQLNFLKYSLTKITTIEINEILLQISKDFISVLFRIFFCSQNIRIILINSIIAFTPVIAPVEL